MTDRGSFKASSDTLRQHAIFWVRHSSDAKRAQMEIEPAVGRGADLGYLAGLNGVEDCYQQWTQAMSDCLETACETFSYLAAALASVANDYDGTDATVATSIEVLDPMNEVGPR